MAWLEEMSESLLLTARGMFLTDMEFVQKFTPLDFQVRHFTPSILPNFNSFSKKKTLKMSENGEIYTAGKNFSIFTNFLCFFLTKNGEIR